MRLYTQNQKLILKFKIKNPNLFLSLSLFFVFHFSSSPVFTLLSSCLCHQSSPPTSPPHFLSTHRGQNELSLSIFSSFLIFCFIYFEICVYHLIKSLKTQRSIVIDLICFVINLSFHLSNWKH